MAEEIDNNSDNFLNILKGMKFNLAENIISNSNVLCLEQSVHIKIAINMWQQCISNETKHIFTSSHDSRQAAMNVLRSIHKLEDIIVNKIPNLKLPSICEDTFKRTIHHIGKQICAFIYIIYNTSQLAFDFSNVNQLNVYLNNLCWTHQGSINKLRTAEKIIDHSNLGTREKYLIACNYCLEDKIRMLYQKLPPKSIDYYIKIYKNRTNLYEHSTYCLALYWTCKITREVDRFSEIANGVAVNKFLLKFAIHNRHEAAVQYIMENFADEQMKQDLIEYWTETLDEEDWNEMSTIHRPTYANILVYLLTQMNEIEIDEIWVKNSYVILHAIFYNPHRNFDISSATLKKLIRTMRVSQVFQSITLLWHYSYITFDEFEDLWKECVQYFESSIDSNIDTIVMEWLDNPVMMMIDDVKPLLWLIEMLPDDVRRAMVVSDDTFRMLLSHGRLNIFEQIFEKLYSASSIKGLKRFLSDQILNDVSCNLINENNYEMLSKTLSSFMSKEIDISIWKNNTVYDGLLVPRLLLSKDDYRLSILDKYFSWSFDGDEERIKKCKLHLFHFENTKYNDIRENYFDHIKLLIKLKKWESVEKSLAWIYRTIDDSAQSRDWKLQRVRKILFLAYGKRGAMLLVRFITTCFERNEISNLKESLKDGNELSLMILELFRVVIYVEVLLKKREETLKELDNLLAFCFSSNIDEIEMFKKNFMFSKNFYEFLLKLLMKKSKVQNMILLFTWWKPSIEETNLFKKKFLSFLKAKTDFQKKFKRIVQKRINEKLKLFISMISEGTQV